MKQRDSLERSRWPGAALSLCLALSLSACSQVKHVLGFGTGDEADVNVIDAPDPNEYVLVKNPQYSVASGPGISPPPPEYIWVKRKDVPFTADAFMRGKKVLEASPQDEAKWADRRPPDANQAPRPDERFFVPPDQLNQPPRKAPAESVRRTSSRPADPAALLRPAYGYVVLVKGKQVYTDLSTQNGVAVGSTLIIFREGEEIKHPVTGASLGRADEEVARARILEVGDQTSVAEVIDVKEGQEVRAKDKVKLIRAN